MSSKPPRNPDRLAREIDAMIRVRDIREWYRLKEELAPRWGEMFLLSGMFAFGLGLIVTIIFVLPQDNPIIYYFWLLWSTGYLLMTIVAVEFLIRKFRATRRVIELNLKRIERLEREVSAFKRAEARRTAAEATENE